MKSILRILLVLGAVSAPSIPAAEIGKEGLLLDLEPHYTRRFDATNYTGISKELPLIKTLVFDGLRFNLNGEFCLWGALRASRGEYLPIAVKGVPVNAAFDELHLVHHGRWSDVEDRQVARVRLNYADGSRHEYQIRWAYHVCNWAFLPSYEVETMGDPNAKFIWRDPAGDNTQHAIQGLPADMEDSLHEPASQARGEEHRFCV